MGQLPSPSLSNSRLFLAAICIGAFLSHYTAGIVTVSLPKLTVDFNMSIQASSWIISGYFLVIVILLPVMGRLGDTYGHRLIHNTGYVLFTFSSVLVAMSPSLEFLVMFRILQASGAAMFQATNMALITMFLPSSIRGRSLGLVNMCGAMGAMAGPVAGGIISQWFSWPWLFLLHVPAAALATILAFKYIPDSMQAGRRKGSIDMVGAFCFAMMTGIVVLTVTETELFQWNSVQIWTMLFLGGLSAAMFFFRSLRHPQPIIALRTFREPALIFGVLVCFISFYAVNNVLTILPFYYTYLNAAPASIGGMMMAYPIALAVCGPAAGHGSDKFGARIFVIAGLLLMALASMVYAIGLEHMNALLITSVFVLFGIAMGLITSPINHFMMNHVPEGHTGEVGGMIALCRNTGMAFGAAMGLGAVNSVFQTDLQMSPLTLLFTGNAVLGLLIAGSVLFINKTWRVEG